MPDLSKKRLGASVIGLSALLLAGIAGTAIAAQQDAAATPSAQVASSDVSPTKLLDDFNFYVNTANVEMAEACAKALLERGLTPPEFVGVVEDSPSTAMRFDQAYRKALLIPRLEGLAAQLWELYRDGRNDRARSPAEIERNIKLLTGTMSNRLFARERLKEAKEYAVPQLLEVLIDGRDAALRAEAEVLLREMGRDAVAPLCAALPKLGGQTQEVVIRILGAIPYRWSLPALYDVAQSTSTAEVRDAAQRAIERIDERYDPTTKVSGLYRSLGETYLGGSASLLTFAGEKHQLLWSFDPAIGLTPTAIDTSVFHEARAMASAERALALDANDQEAMSLWIAANFQREIDTPEGYDNPVYPANRRDALYYAVAAGPAPVQRVLDRAMTSKNTRLARRAIEALAISAGGPALVDSGNAVRPLAEALTYPDRRVQFEAAAAIARANPQSAFVGSDRVVPVLAASIRDAGKRYVAVIASNAERQQEYRTILEAQGYTVLAPGSSFSAVANEVASVPGVDVAVISLSPEETLSTVEQMRSSARLSATPVVAMLPTADVNRLDGRFTGSPVVELRNEGISEDQLAETVNQAVTRASGAAMDEAETIKYSLDAIDVLTHLAESGNSVLDVGDATVPLLAALKETDGEVQMRVASLLGHICRPGVQSAIIDTAMENDGETRLSFLHAGIESAKRCGNQLDERLVGRLLEVAETGDGDEATAAAAMLGALNLPNTRLVPLITGGTSHAPESSARLSE